MRITWRCAVCNTVLDLEVSAVRMAPTTASEKRRRSSTEGNARGGVSGKVSEAKLLPTLSEPPCEQLRVKPRPLLPPPMLPPASPRAFGPNKAMELPLPPLPPSSSWGLRRKSLCTWRSCSQSGCVSWRTVLRAQATGSVTLAAALCVPRIVSMASFKLAGPPCLEVTVLSALCTSLCLMPTARKAESNSRGESGSVRERRRDNARCPSARFPKRSQTWLFSAFSAVSGYQSESCPTKDFSVTVAARFSFRGLLPPSSNLKRVRSAVELPAVVPAGVTGTAALAAGVGGAVLTIVAAGVGGAVLPAASLVSAPMSTAQIFAALPSFTLRATAMRQKPSQRSRRSGSVSLSSQNALKACWNVS
mmetsp:Transcript_31692/g.67378  ORF Transcript_31692/g.67378 Transcript_31692/m.67378 type:complete len:362 (-) Transcript_31692:1530-2615(-)